MMIAVSSGLSFSRVPVWAIAVTPPVKSVPELVIHFLEPLTTQRPSFSSAVVCVPPASVPAFSSVRPKAQSRSPPRVISRGGRAASARRPAGVGGGVFLGETEGPEPLAAPDYLAELVIFLLGRPEGDERGTAQRDVRLHRDADGGVGAADLLQRQIVGDEGATRAAAPYGER